MTFCFAKTLAHVDNLKISIQLLLQKTTYMGVNSSSRKNASQESKKATIKATTPADFVPELKFDMSDSGKGELAAARPKATIKVTTRDSLPGLKFEMSDSGKGEFAAAHPFEVTTFNRKIKDFPAIIELGLPNPCLVMEFEIPGRGHGMTSNWKLEMSHEKGWLYLELRPNGDFEGVDKFVFEATTVWNSRPPSYSHRVTCPILKRIRWDSFETIKDSSRSEGVLEMRFKIFRALDKPSPCPDHNEDKAVFSRKLMEQYREELSTNLGSMLETGVNSDFVIQVKNSDENVIKMKVHKAILMSRSPVFRKMLESPMTEQGTGSMVIVDLSSDCVKTMLKWMYTGQLDDGWEKVPEEMVNAANKYELHLLLEYFDKNLHTVCNLENASRLEEVAQVHELTNASKKIAEFIEANSDKILRVLDPHF